MTWSDFHTKSEKLASEAEAALKDGELVEARRLYADAAKAEVEALKRLDKTKQRTLGIITVSAVALWYKAKQFAQAEQIAYQVLSEGSLPEFAVIQVKELLQTIWNEVERQRADVKCKRTIYLS